MKAKSILIFLLFVSFFLCSCSAVDTSPTEDVIAVSGSLSYYAAMEESVQKEQLLNRRIEVSGTVSGTGITTIFIGEEKKDGISFSCTFSENTPALEKISVGSNIRLHGVCTSIIGNCIYLDRCTLSDPLPTATETTTTPPTTAAAATVPSTTVSPTTVPPTTVPPTTVPPTTVPPATVPPTTVPPATVPPATVPSATVPSVTVPSTPAPTKPTDGIIFVNWPETTSRNETAEVTISGKPNTKYTITVYYKSGASTAKGLEPKTSDNEGYVTWSWKVGGKTAPGTFRIVVSGGGEESTVNFTVKTN